MSIPTAAAAMTSAFLNSAGMEAQPEITAFLTPLDKPTNVFVEPEGGDYIQLAQVDAENLLKGGAAILLCTTMTGKSPEECLRELTGRSGTQLPDIRTPQGPTQAGNRRVQDGYVSPDELGDVRAISYYGDVYNNRDRRVSLWDVDVEGFGDVCLGTLDDTAYPAQDTMQIVARESCDVQFSGRIIGAEQPDDDILGLPPQTVPQTGYSRANGDNSTFGNFVSIDSDREGYPFVAFGEHLRTGEVGCFLFENRDVEFAPRIDDGVCTANGADYPQP